MRLKTGIKETEIPPGKISDSLKLILEQASPDCGARPKDLKDCIVMINGKQGSYRSVVKDGDEVAFLSPSGGG